MHIYKTQVETAIEKTKERIKKLEEKIEKIKEMTALQFAKKFYVETVYIQDGIIYDSSDVDPGEAMVVEVISSKAPDYPHAYEGMCETITAHYHRKTVKLYIFNYKALSYIASKIDLNAEKARKIAEYQDELNYERNRLHELKERLNELIKKENEFKEALRKIEEFIKEKNFVELEDYFEQLDEKNAVKIAEASYEDERVSAKYYPDKNVLSVFRMFNSDFWGTKYYSTEDVAQKIVESIAEKAAETPWNYMYVLRRVVLGGDDDRVAVHISKNEELKKRMIENFIKYMTKTELSEKELEYPPITLFSENWHDGLHGQICRALGIFEKVEETRKIRIQRLNEYRAKKEEEEKKKREEKERKRRILHEEAQKIVEKMHYKLRVSGIDFSSFDPDAVYVTIRVERCDKKTFSEAIKALKDAGATFDWREKVWNLKLKPPQLPAGVK